MSLQNPERYNPHEGDPSKRMQRVLAQDMVRLEVYDRVKRAMHIYRERYQCEPMWVRVSDDLVNRCGDPVFQQPCTICGLAYIPTGDIANAVEVGSSALA
jgi:hypothetical protein